MEKREVVIVGAGPAGATTAIILSRLGHDVLLLDRSQFTRDKVCGDAVPAGTMELLSKLGMEEQIQSAEKSHLFHLLESIRIFPLLIKK